MRKRYKKKRKSCSMCKTHKTKGMKRWKKKEEIMLREFEYEKRHQKNNYLYHHMGFIKNASNPNFDRNTIKGL